MELEKDVASSRRYDTSIEGAVLEALYNDVILGNIFKTCTNIKNCRLICKKWNDAILSQRPQRILLRLDKINDDESTSHFLHLERRLTKNISTHEDENGNLQRFCNEYGDQVEELKFNCEYDEAATALIQGLIYTLENNLCPNVRSLCIDLFKFEETKFPLNLPLMPKLEFLRFWFSSLLVSKDYKNFLQLIVKNSPNLMTIEYSGAFDVDFNVNHKLKNIKHSLNADENVNAKANGLKKTLAQTANSLEKLRLVLSHDEEGDSEDDDEDEYLDFPIMPKLTSLKLLSSNHYKVGRNLDELTSKLLPNLNYLKLENTGSMYRSRTELKILQDLVERGNYKHSGVVTLSFKGVKNPLLLKDLRVWFPNLETFEVVLIPQRENYSENPLEKLFQTLKEVKLKVIRIKIPYQYDTVELIRALEPNYLQLFEGLKLLYLENIEFNGSNTDRMGSKSRSAWKDGIAGPIETLEKILLHINQVRGLKVVFKNFLLHGSIARRILGFIDENKIPFILI